MLDLDEPIPRSKTRTPLEGAKQAVTRSGIPRCSSGPHSTLEDRGG